MNHRWLAPMLVATIGCGHNEVNTRASNSTLAERIGFDADVVALLERESKKPVEQITRSDFVGTKPVSISSPGLFLWVPDSDTQATVARLRSSLGARGYLVFKGEPSFGLRDRLDQIGVLKATDLYDILRALGTEAGNYDLDNAAVIAKLQAWQKRYPFEITGAGRDFVEARFLRAPDDIDLFAKEVYGFCPDIVEQGTETVEALADEMRRLGTLYLWWD